jgi:hypothetical protein
MSLIGFIVCRTLSAGAINPNRRCGVGWSMWWWFCPAPSYRNLTDLGTAIVPILYMERVLNNQENNHVAATVLDARRSTIFVPLC